MAPLLEDPRIRQTWNSISHNAETATETAAAGIWTFLHNYINPCFISIGESFDQCTAPCFPDREERGRRVRERDRTRGRAEYSFDFYDDWDDEQAGSSGGLLGWGNDELDRLLAGSGSHSHGSDGQPSGRKRKMSYGTRRTKKRKGTLDGLPDPTIIPSTSALGFLQRLPFKIGGTLRYKPSAADLQDHPGTHRAELGDDAEAEPLMDDDRSEDGDEDLNVRKTRERSFTTGSGDTSDSFRSRGDLFPSDGEDDAVPLSDEFAITLARRNTMTNLDDRSSGNTGNSKGKGFEGSRTTSRAMSRTSHSSSHSLAGPGFKHDGSAKELHRSESGLNAESREMPSLSELEQEEERLRNEEEAELLSRREAAIRLAAQRGLSVGEIPTPSTEPETLTAQNFVGGHSVSANQASTATKVERQPSDHCAEPSISNTSTSEDAVDSDEAPKPHFVPARLPNF